MIHSYIGKTFRLEVPGLLYPQPHGTPAVIVEPAVCVAFSAETGLGVYRGPDGRHYQYGAAYIVGPLDESGKGAS